MHQHSLSKLLLTIAMVAALAMTPVAPEAGNIIYIGAGVAAIGLLRQADITQFRRPIVWMPLLGLGLLGMAYALAVGSLSGLLGIFFFAPLLLIGPLVSLVTKVPLDGRAIAALAFCGAAGTAAVALVEYSTTGTSRVGLSVANPIHFADVALVVGFIAVLGVIYTKGVTRYLYLAGPAFAAVAVLLSGTRGAVLAIAAMAGLALLLALAMRLISRRVLFAGGLAAILVMAVAIAGGVLETSGVQRVLLDMTAIAQEGGVPTDESTSERMQMYTGGLAAFLDAPLVGHGPFDYVAAAAAHMTAPFSPPHLHSDLANFAASGGIMGLIAYVLFLLAPLVEVLRSAGGPERKPLIVVVSILVFGYFAMGLTNAVIGLLTLTVLYSCICVLAGGLARRSAGIDGSATHDPAVNGA